MQFGNSKIIIKYVILINSTTLSCTFGENRRKKWNPIISYIRRTIKINDIGKGFSKKVKFKSKFFLFLSVLAHFSLFPVILIHNWTISSQMVILDVNFSFRAIVFNDRPLSLHFCMDSHSLENILKLNS